MALLFVALFNSILGLSILFPVLAPLGRELGLGYFEVTTLSTAYAVMQFVTAPMWGRASERRGRKPILLIGVIGFSVTFFAFAGVVELARTGALAHGALLALLIAARFVGGAVSSATLPSAQAYAADVSSREDRTSAMAVIGAAFGLGIIFGPVLGAAASSLTGDLLAPVYLSASVAAMNAVFIALALPEPLKHEGTAQAPRAMRELASRAWPVLAIAIAATLASVGTEQTIAFYFQTRLDLDGEATVRTVGLALAAYAFMAVIAQGFVVRRLRWPPVTLLRVGLPTAIAGYVVLAFAHDLSTLVVALVLQGFGQGLVVPGVTAAVSLSGSHAEQGSLGGLNSAAQALGRVIGPVLAGALYEMRAEIPYATSAAVLVLVFAAVSIWPRSALGDPREFNA